MNRGDSDAHAAGFLDVATNTLAVVILAVLLVLLLAEAAPGRPEDRARASERPAVRVQPATLSRPFIDTWFVFEAGIIRWRQEDLVEPLLETPPGDAVVGPGGTALLRTYGARGGDFDAYRVTFRPDFEALAATALPLGTDADAAAATRAILARSGAKRGANLVVWPAGMPGFARLWPHLREEPAWLRWFLQGRDNDPVRIQRLPAGFGRYEYAF